MGSGSAVSRDVTRGGCGLRKSLSSLMAGRGCSCFVVWPRGPSTGAYGLLGGIRSWCQMAASRRAHASERSLMSPLPGSLSSQWASHPTPPQQTLLRPAGMTHGPMKSVHFCPGSQCTHTRVCPPGVELLFPPVLWHSCTQAPLDYKAKCSGGSSSWCQTPRLGSLMWDSVLRENFCDIIVLQFVGHPPGGYGIWLYWVCALPTISLGFFMSLDVSTEYLFW